MPGRVTTHLFEVEVESQSAKVSTVLGEADILNLLAKVTTVLGEVDISNDQAKVTTVLGEVDITILDWLWIGKYVGGSPNLTYITGFRFQNVNIPKDSIIQVANFTAWVTEADESVECEVRAVADPDAPAFSYGSWMPADAYPLTAASGTLTHDAVADEWCEALGIEALIQEVIDQDLWTSGCPITIILDGSSSPGRQKVKAGPHASGAKLDLTWIEP